MVITSDEYLGYPKDAAGHLLSCFSDSDDGFTGNHSPCSGLR